MIPRGFSSLPFCLVENHCEVTADNMEGGESVQDDCVGQDGKRPVVELGEHWRTLENIGHSGLGEGGRAVERTK